MTPDPIGVLGGGNFYRYVGNNPVNYWDWLGLHTGGFRGPADEDEVGNAGVHSGNYDNGWSKTKVGNTDYQVRDKNKEVKGKIRGKILGGRGATKCNILVWDHQKSNGNQPHRFYPDPNDPGGRIPLTDDYEQGRVKGCRKLKANQNPEEGDVVVSNGHMGIYEPLPNGSHGTISASSKLRKVAHNNFGFRPNDNTSIFRCQ